MSGGDVDGEPSLSSRNTIGNGEPQLKFSKPNVTKIVGIGSGQLVVWFGVLEGFPEGLRKLGGGGRSGYAEV